MLCKRAKEILELKAKSGIKIPEDALLSELFLEAMLWIASKCVPNELLGKYTNDRKKIYRNISQELFIVIPDKPNFSSDTDHLMIDEALSYAVINEVLFLINKEPFYRELSFGIIAQYNANYGIEKDY